MFDDNKWELLNSSKFNIWTHVQCVGRAYDSYNFLSSCRHCSSSFCLFYQCDTTFVKYIPCPLSNCYSCASSSVSDNEISQTYCISCKDKLGINNNDSKITKLQSRCLKEVTSFCKGYDWQ